MPQSEERVPAGEAVAAADAGAGAGAGQLARGHGGDVEPAAHHRSQEEEPREYLYLFWDYCKLCDNNIITIIQSLT